MSVQPCGHRSGRPNVAQRPRDGSARRHAAGSDLIEAFLKSLREIDVHARTGTCVRNTLAISRIRNGNQFPSLRLRGKPRKPFLRLVPSAGPPCPPPLPGGPFLPPAKKAGSCPGALSWGKGRKLPGG